MSSMQDELLIRFLLNETAASESKAVKEWLEADPANRKRYAQLETIWISSKKLASSSIVDEEQAWKKFKLNVEKYTKEKTETAVVRPLNPGFRWLRIAAILFLIAGIVVINKFVSNDEFTALSAYNKIITDTLPDGSEITLNKNSNISYASDFTNHRSILLKEGEVFFKVTPDKKHPFIIEADKISVKVVGTSFNVKHLKSSTEIIVETGIVKVSLGEQHVELRHGEKVLIAAGSKKLIKTQNTDQLYNYYQSKILIANNTPLNKITEVLNQTYDTNISFKDNKIGQLTLTTTFKEQSLDQILNVICETLDLEFERNQNQILLSHKQ